MDCLEGMKEIEDGSVDMILCDLPYGTTASSWDKIINMEMLWEQYSRIIKPNGAIALFSSGQFTNKLINSNDRLYRYKWIWRKTKKGNFVNAKNRPMTSYEEICMFSFGCTANGSRIKMNYNPQGIIPCGKTFKSGENRFGSMAGKRPSHQKETKREFTGYPCDVIEFNSVPKPQHPTQKPVELLEYLIKTYTNEGDLVLDNCIGSGTTAVAALNTKRNFIGFELDKGYYDIANQRIASSLCHEL